MILEPDHLERVRLFGLDFVDAPDAHHVATMLMAARPVEAAPHDHRVALVVTPNVDHLVRRDRNTHPLADDLTERAQVVLPDGQPIVWASRLLGAPLRARLAGSSLVSVLWPLILANRRPALVVAGSAVAVDKLRADGPAVSAIEAPVLSVDRPDELERFADECLRVAIDTRAQYVFVTLGYPKQNLVIGHMLERWPADEPTPVFLAIGASFDMYYGLVRRAPGFVQGIGMEWFFRFIQEPKRLFKRYFVDDPAFVPMVLRERRQRRSTR